MASICESYKKVNKYFAPRTKFLWYVPRMISKAEITKEKARRLRGVRERIEPNRQRASEIIGVSYSTLTSHENGRRDFDEDAAQIYAKAFGVPVNHLLASDLLNGDSPVTIPAKDGSIATITVPVYGQAAGGLWLEGEDMPFDDVPVVISPVSDYPAHAQYARKVVGNSVSHRIPDGFYAIFVRFDSYGGRIFPGDLVDCMRTRSGLCEHTVKVFDVDRLMTDSKELTRQVAIPLGHNDDGTIVEIVGIAVGVYSPLVPGAHRTK